jgi:alpha-tubulin suppressor-like RCC1 family protein
MTFGQMFSRFLGNLLLTVFLLLSGQVLAATPMVSVSHTHTCALLSSGTVECWGVNTYGEIGNATIAPSNTPVAVAGITNAISISAGQSFTCATLDIGTVKCWGINDYGQLGNGSSTSYSVPVSVSGITNAISVSAGYSSACAVLSSGTVQCWGNLVGQLGFDRVKPTPIPVSVSGINNAISVAVGVAQTCVLLSSGTVQCWGQNTSGELGNGNTINSSIPVSVAGIDSAISVSAGSGYTCVLLNSGSVQCWGDNSYGQLGNATTAPSSTPITVVGVTSAISLAAGGSHACAALRDGAVQCWGRNNFGQLGDGSDSLIRTSPVSVTGINSAISVSAGGYGTTCAVLGSGYVQCWGRNDSGQIGDGITSESRTTPASVLGISNAVSVSNSDSEYSCAVISDGSVKCWGTNGWGQLGNGKKTDSTSPVAVTSVSGAASVTTGHSHTCAVLSSGVVRCWGGNYSGLLGDGSVSESSLTPVEVFNLSSALSVSASSSYTCAVVNGGTVQCWGKNDYGRLGNGSTIDSIIPVTVSGISNAISVSVSRSGAYGTTCAVLGNGLAQCWGSNGFGMFGNGKTTDSLVPIFVSGINNAAAITVGTIHTCALLSSGGVQCWGSNDYGQLGTGTVTNSKIPVPVRGITNAVSVSAGRAHTCALISNGTVQCWGGNYYGQLGDGTLTASSIPVSVLGITNAVSVSASSGSTCAVLSSGIVQCWGRNRGGLLGVGQISNPIPGPVVGLNGQGFLNLGGTSINTLSADADKVFGWAEKTYPAFFAPANGTSLTIPGYRYRTYSGGGFLAVNDNGTAHLYYLGPLNNNTVMDLGLLSNWLTQAGP